MKSFSLLTAILFVTFGSTVWADDPAPEDNAELTPVEQPTALEGEYAPAVMGGAYTDFPGYYPGYSSYRGLGFMGSCCEQNSCCAQNAWDGYCEQKSYGHHNPFHGWADKLRCRLAAPVCCDKGCGQKGCCEEPCAQKGCCEDTCSQKAGCGVKPFCDLGSKLHFGWKRPVCTSKSDCCPEPCCEPKGGKSCGVETKCHKPLCDKLHALRNRSGWLNGLGFRSYGEYYGPFDGEAMPTYADPVPTDGDQQNLEPTPESLPEPPAEVTTDYVPSFPDLTRDDRSADRTMLRRLPEVR